MEGFLVKQSGFLQQVSKKYYVLTRDHLYGFKRPEDLRQACECIKLDQHFQTLVLQAPRSFFLGFVRRKWEARTATSPIVLKGTADLSPGLERGALAE